MTHHKYKISVEYGVLVVTRITENGWLHEYYFATSEDRHGDMQEMYNLLCGAGLDVEVINDHCRQD